MHAQCRNLTPAAVQIAYTFIVILCQEWNRAIIRRYQSITSNYIQSKISTIRWEFDNRDGGKIDFYMLLFHSLFKVEFDINHFVLGEHRER